MSTRRSIVGLIALFLAVLAPAAARAQQVNTFSGWNGTDFAFPFGASNTATYGQTFAAGGSSLNDFSFWLANRVNGGALQFNAYVATWTGSNIGSVLWSSPGTSLGTNSTSFTQYLFNTGGVAVTPGQTYVAFLNASPFIGANPGVDATLNVGANKSNPYASGAYVFDNNGSDFSALTSPWDQPGDGDTFGNGFDLAFIANFGANDVSPVPEPASMGLLAAGLAAMAGGGLRRRKRPAA